MNNSKLLRARLLVELPAERFVVEIPDGRNPKVGDILELDQGLTGKNGLPMVLAFCNGDNGEDLYQVEVYESEISLIEAS